jgi:hypothetical protein
MHTITNDEQTQIIHYNPDLSGDVIISVKTTISDIKINNKQIKYDKVVTVVLSGELLKDLFSLTCEQNIET